MVFMGVKLSSLRLQVRLTYIQYIIDFKNISGLGLRAANMIFKRRKPLFFVGLLTTRLATMNLIHLDT